ncbi:MAG: 1,4-beta-xylanase [Lachnospiraceae bacterium]|nr:1,4-beta-xylanase [Lachnospiraceae bacterium]
MDFIKGFTFAPFIKRGYLMKKETLASFDSLIARTGTEFVILVPNGLQDTPQTETIDYTSDATMGDEELEEFIDYAYSKNIEVALKPTVNCKNGTWRAHISFFEEDVPCEPKWCNWFRSYSEFQCHFAGIAERKKCKMFIAGCEMVQSEHREAEWRKVISDIRNVYTGPVSYNTDKYQEHNVTWWDAVDIISSSGYYPMNDWENQLDRIEKVVKKYKKPFFFAECGCMSVLNSNLCPNDWSLRGEIDLKGQAEWFRTMFEACEKRDFVDGFSIWDWRGRLYPLSDAATNKDYAIYGKPAEAVVKEFYDEK